MANNGGSRTLLKCGETLSSLGHDVIFYGCNIGGYTWHKPVGIKFSKNKFPDDCDAAIATGYHSVPSVVKCDSKHKLYYIRGFEKWVVDEGKLFESYKKLKCIVNSEWLSKKLSDNGIENKIIYPGLDFDIFYDENAPRNYLGALYHTKHATKNHVDAVKVANKANIDLIMLNRDLKNGSQDECREFYNKTFAWFAPTELEGLHNPPMEAALCGSSIVCSNSISNGMSDYAIHNKTALVYKHGDLDCATRFVRLLYKDKNLRDELNGNMLELLKNKIGSRKQNMSKFADWIGNLR